MNLGERNAKSCLRTGPERLQNHARKLAQVSRTSGGVMHPESILRALELVDEEGNIKDQPIRVTRTDTGTWEVSVIDPNDYPQAEA